MTDAEFLDDLERRFCVAKHRLHLNQQEWRRFWDIASKARMPTMLISGVSHFRLQSYLVELRAQIAARIKERLTS